MIPFLNSPNHASRNGVKITDIVLHWMDGTLAAADATFANAAHQTSAHYGVEGDVIHQYVHDGDVAWHSGDWNENQRSIGIEHSAQPGRDASPATITTSVALIVGLCREYGIDPSHIYPHNKFYATQCPGTLPVAEIIARVRAGLGSAPIVTPPNVPTNVPVPVPSGGLIVQTIDLRSASSAHPVNAPGVTPLQRLLGITADGIAGDHTRWALGDQQAKHGVAVDYIFGPASASAFLAR